MSQYMPLPILATAQPGDTHLPLSCSHPGETVRKQRLTLPSVLGAVIEDCAGAQEGTHLCWETWELGKG